MKKIFSRYVILTIGLFLALACQPPDPLDQDEPLLNLKDEAAKYAHNVVTMASLASPDQSPFNSLDIRIEQEDGLQKSLPFSELTQEQRQIFLQAWKEHTAKQLASEIDHEGLLDLHAQNSAFAQALSSNNRSLNQDFKHVKESYQQAYLNEIKKRQSKTPPYRSGKGPKPRLLGINQHSIGVLRPHYKIGNIFVSPTNLLGGYVGHASIMSEDVWNDDWNQDELAMVGVSSWPHQLTWWKDAKEGVQNEPLSVWAGNDSPIKNVRLYRPAKSHWVWRWFWFHCEIEEASDHERREAIQHAKDKIGKQYNWNFAWKHDTNFYYCSQLVWKAWNEVHHRYDMDAGIFDTWVSPSDLGYSESARFLADYPN